jgi:hypothetical protein
MTNHNDDTIDRRWLMAEMAYVIALIDKDTRSRSK